jgi:uncharacterized protein YbaR (Trm112 family)
MCGSILICPLRYTEYPVVDGIPILLEQSCPITGGDYGESA